MTLARWLGCRLVTRARTRHGALSYSRRVRTPVAVIGAAALAASLITAAPLSAQEPPRASTQVTRAAEPAPDPAAEGPYAIERRDVVRSWDGVDVGFEGPVEDVAEITYPVTETGDVVAGRHPVVVLLHGMHASCARTGPLVTPRPWWCSDSEPSPVPSYLGYRYLADTLASQGRVVVSISANGINAQDLFTDYGIFARAKLVRHHLVELRAADAGRVPVLDDLLVGHLDLARTVLVGHSRGGDAMVRASQELEREAEAPAVVVGVVNLAPIASVSAAPANSPTITLLPACDGDVRDLQGQTLVDRGRDLYGDSGFLRSSVWFAGGNHNYLNTEWTPGTSESRTGKDDAEYLYADDAASGSCRPRHRITPAQERAVGLAYVAASARWMQDADARMLPFLDGTGDVPPAVLAEGIQTRSASLAGPDRLLVVPSPLTSIDDSGLDARPCRGSQLSVPDDDRLSHLCGYGRVEPGNDTSWLGPTFFRVPLPDRTAVRLAWAREGVGWVGLDSPRDLRAIARLSARVVVDPATRGTFAMALRDTSGATAVVPLRGLPLQPLSRGSLPARLVPQQAWIDPRDAAGIDLARVTDVGLLVTGSGFAWILDVSERSGEPAPAAQPLPLVTMPLVQDFRVGPGTSTVDVRVELDAPASQGAEMVVEVSLDPALRPSAPTRVAVEPGASSAVIPLSVTMPRVTGPDDQYGGAVYVYPVRGANGGSNVGYLQVVPEGTQVRRVEVVDPVVNAGPGRALAWDFTSSDRRPVSIQFAFADAAMDYSDLQPRFRSLMGLPARGPIASGEGLDLISQRVAPGRFRVKLPLARTAAPAAWISFRINSVSGAVLAEGDQVLTGTVGGRATSTRP